MNQQLAIPDKRPNGCPPGQATMIMPNGSRIGNPPHVPTDENRALVTRLAPSVPPSLIAEVLGVSTFTLRKYYGAEIANVRADLTKEFGETVIGKCRNGEMDALKFYLTRMGGWDETKHHEHSGPGGGVITHVDVARLTEVFQGMTPDERAIAERVLSLVASSGTAGHDGGPDGSSGGAADTEARRAE